MNISIRANSNHTSVEISGNIDRELDGIKSVARLILRGTAFVIAYTLSRKNRDSLPTSVEEGRFLFDTMKREID